MSIMLSFQEQQERIIRHEQERKEWLAWLKLPEWEKYESDKINGVDDGEPPAEYYAPRIRFNIPKWIIKGMEDGTIPY